MNPSEAKLKRELFCTVNEVEYCVEIEERDEARAFERARPRLHVTVKRYQDDLKWWRMEIYGTAEEETTSELEAIREVFRRSRSAMRKWIRYWQEDRAATAGEKGGKKAYYTKHANKARPHILREAAQWRLAKAIWKEITRL